MAPGGVRERGRAERAGIHFFLLALSLAAVGCKSGVAKRVDLPGELLVLAVAVYPFGFRWDEPAYRSFELSHRLIESAKAAANDRLFFFGPSEFKVFRPQDDNAWASSSVVSRLPACGVRPERAMVLRPWAEKRVHTAQKELYDGKGRAVGMAAVQETIYLGHVEVLHPSSQKVVVELTGEAVVDPFSEVPEREFDPAPELTALMERLTTTAIQALEDHAAPLNEPKELPFTVAFNPKAAFTYAEDGRPSLELQIATMDPVESELLTQNRARFANPEVSEAETTQWSRLPGGLVVTRSSEEANVQVGDILLTVDGQPALPCALDRLRYLPVPAQVKVRRASGAIEEVVLP
ncbi:MAG: hypothetical protein ACOZIN_14820 [Myxococcota bacterium]